MAVLNPKKDLNNSMKSESKKIKKRKSSGGGDDSPKIKVKREEKSVSSPKKDKIKVKQEAVTPKKSPKHESKTPESKKKNKKANLEQKIKDKKASLIEKKKGKPSETATKSEAREKQKKLRDERRKKDKKPEVVDLSVRAKQVWEEVRREDCPEDKRNTLLKELLGLVKGNVAKIIYAHDTVRVIECLVALGDESIRDALYEELKEDLIPLAKSKYASFFVQKLVRYGSKEQREAVFKALEGRVADLTKHKTAVVLVEACYNDFSNATLRNRFLQEFFGPEFRHFKEENLRTVVQLMESHPEKARDIVKHLAVNVSTLITKGCYNHSLVHTVMYNYMLALNKRIADSQDNNEKILKERSEFINQLRDVLVHIVHSQDGARLARHAIWHGTAKDRKAIIKSFKTFMVKIAQEEHGHLVLIAILDSVDDTKLTSKAILGELTANDEVMEAVISNETSRKVITYTMVGRSKTYFHPDYLANIAAGDGNVVSKKDPEIRHKELRSDLSEAIFPHVCKNMDGFLEDNAKILFLGALYQNLDADTQVHARQSLMALAEKITQPFKPGSGLIETPAMHMLLKKIVDKCDFYQMLLDNLTDDEVIKAYLACNRGSFLFVTILNMESEAAKKALKAKLKPFKNYLKEQTNKGAMILNEKLSKM